jgi:3-oxoacyl-[acyl-carrier-protein] synthase III
VSPGAGKRIGVVGRGHALPSTIRTNDDPVFDWLKKNKPGELKDLFYGYDKRRVLAGDESIVDFMHTACAEALSMAGIEADEVDLLLGYVSVSEFVMPNGLAQLHHKLGLRPGCWAIPLNVEYSNFNAALVFADAMIQAGQVRNVLVACGGNWSRYVNYHLGPSASAADGAGAAVVARTDDRSSFRVVDFETITTTSVTSPAATDQSSADVLTYGQMFMGADVVAEKSPIPLPSGDDGDALVSQALLTVPYFHITAVGMQEFAGFGTRAPVEVVRRLLTRNGVDAGDVSITAHQTSRKLLDYWNQQLRPALLFDTLSTFANMTLASIPVNFSFGYDQFATDYLVLLGIGPELHTNAVLLRRQG